MKGPNLITGCWSPDCGHTFKACGRNWIYSLRSLAEGSFLCVSNVTESRIIREYPTPGKHSCHICLLPGKAVVCDYSSGSLSVFPLGLDGLPCSAPIVKYFAPTSHLHSSWVSPSDGTLVVVDQGADLLYCFDSSAAAAETFPNVSFRVVSLPDGCGPRHCAFGDQNLYVATEFSDEVIVLSYPAMEMRQRSLVNEEHPRGGGHIAISNDGRFLYVSSRRKSDGIGVFRVGPAGLIEKIGFTHTGAHPRHFAISPDGSQMAVACRDDDSIEIYGISQDTGLLSDVSERIPINKPVFVDYQVSYT